ncbi:MAG TPA: hypothetical protein VGR26_15060 [Acidimicrobiales bacterium]|nr:hypothetical protein [Acidimicrobiales bacterium]
MPDAAVEIRVELDNRVPGHSWSEPPGWTRIDVTNALRSLHIRRGLPAADAHVADPGEAVLVFDNNNGFLDREFPASPYAALLTPGRQLRLRFLNAAGQWATFFQGTVDDWPTTIVGGGFDAAVELVVTDIIGHLGTSLSPPSVVEYELQRGVRYPRPLHLFPLREDVAGPDVLYTSDTSDFAAVPSARGASPAGGSEIVPYAGITGLRCESLGEVLLTVPAVMPDPPFSIAGLVVVPEKDYIFGIMQRAGRFRVGQVLQGTTAQARAQLANNTVVTVTGGTVSDGAPHLIAATISLGPDQINLYLDGAFVQGAAVALPLAAGSGNTLMAQGTGGELAMVGVWDVHMDASFWAKIYNDMFRPWQGQTAPQRLGALVDLVAPGAPRSFAASAFIMLPASLKSQPILDIARRTVEAADGMLWASGANVLRFLTRVVGEPAAALRTYGTGGVPVIEMEPVSPPLVTETLITNEAGSQQVFHDTAASARVGHHRLEMTDMPLARPDDMYYRAERAVHYGSRRRPHIGKLYLRPVDDQVGFPDTLTLGPSARIDVAYERPWAGVVTERAEVYAIEHDAVEAGFADWLTTVHLRPVRTRRLLMSVPLGSQGASTPDTPANSVTGDLDLRAWCAQNSWTDSPNGVILAKGDFATVASSYMLRALTGGRLRFNWQNAAGATFVLDAKLPRGGNRFIWVRATLTVATGLARILISEDGNDWWVLAQTTVGATNVRDTAAALEVGARTTSAGAVELPLDGQVFYAEVRNGIGGPVVARLDPTNDAPGAGAGAWVASTGETWTLRAGSGLSAW